MSEAAVIAPVRRDLDRINATLAAWLVERMPAASGLTIKDLSYPLGAGLSNETILFEASWLENGEQRQDGFVLRLSPEEYRVHMDLNFKGQFDLHRNLQAAAIVPVPEVLWFDDNASLFGAPFFVMKRLRGKVAVSHPPYVTHGFIAEAPAAQQRMVWHNSIVTLAKLNHIPLDSIKLLDKPQYGATGWEQEWAYWMKSHSWSRDGRVLPTSDAVLAWLEENKPEERSSGLCWGDSRIGNLMFDDAFNVIAVMDWEGASLGGGLQDLGFWLFLSSIMTDRYRLQPPGFGSREETIALWENISGLSAKDILWYEVFGGFKLASHVSRKLTLDRDSRSNFNYENNRATRLLADMLGLPAPQDIH